MDTSTGRLRAARNQRRSGRMPSTWATCAVAVLAAAATGLAVTDASPAARTGGTLPASVELGQTADVAGQARDRAEASQQATRRALVAQAAADAAAADAARLLAERTAAAERVARDAQREAVATAARADPRALAQAHVAERGWAPSQFACLDQLWTKESSWSYEATNRSSGAYGIPQALPGSKMASAGEDWRGNPATQIAWGLDYIASVYGSPCSAWSHSVRLNWY